MVLAESVAMGAMVSVRTGNMIPCDSVVVEGTLIVDKSSLTGESHPVRKTIGDEVSGGESRTLMINGPMLGSCYIYDITNIDPNLFYVDFVFSLSLNSTSSPSGTP